MNENENKIVNKIKSRSLIFIQDTHKLQVMNEKQHESSARG
jgi:hypothetical protein